MITCEHTIGAGSMFWPDLQAMLMSLAHVGMWRHGLAGYVFDSCSLRLGATGTNSVHGHGQTHLTQVRIQ